MARKETNDRLSKTRVKNALKKTRGNITMTAKILKTSRSAVKYAIEKHKLEEFLKDQQNGVYDEVVNVFYEKMFTDKSESAVRFYLETQGRSKGWTRKPLLTMESVDDLIDVFDRLTTEERQTVISRLIQSASTNS